MHPDKATAAPTKLPWYPWAGERPFYGWVIVFVGAVTQFAQGLANQGYASFLGPLGVEFGWSKAVMAGPRSLTQIESSVLGPVEGFLVDKFGPRRMVLIGTFVLGSGLILFGFTHALWLFYLSNIIITLGTGFQGMLVMSVAINHWFQRRRTIAQSVMLIGFAMAGVVGIPALVFCMTLFGWRAAAIGSGIFVWVVGFPCAMLLSRRPEPHGLLPDGGLPGIVVKAPPRPTPVADEYDFTLHQAIRTRAFWLLAVGGALGGIATVAVQTHLFLHLEQDVRLPASTVALVWSIASLSNIPARLIGGFFGDRMPKNVLYGLSTAVIGAAVFLLGTASSLLMAVAFALLYGLGWGVRTPVANAIQGDYFGKNSQGIIRGWLMAISIPFSVSAPVIAGYMADVQGSYRTAFSIIAILSLVGAGMVFMAAPPKPPMAPRAGDR